MRPTPILFLSDNPSTSTGLARITRDLCGMLSRNPRFRVGSLGLGGTTSRRLPWAQYVIDERLGAWGSGDIERAWTDFAGQERGVVFTIWDATRTHWLSQPQYCGDQRLMDFLTSGHFALWGYMPIDATGPGDRLSSLGAHSLLGYNRILAYTKWGMDVIERSIGKQEAHLRALDWLPHGIDMDRWVIRDREEAKKKFYPLVHEGDRLIGVVATNQPRKDWGLIAQVCSRMMETDERLRAWWHVDLIERAWSINALLSDFGLVGKVKVTGPGAGVAMSQDDLCWAMNACDVTLHPGAGEGFGYPIFESLACGTPVVHGDYAGGADVLKQCFPDASMDDGSCRYLVPSDALRFEGIHNQIRPVFDPAQWIARAQLILGQEWHSREVLRASIAHLDWKNLWPSFERWFEGNL